MNLRQLLLTALTAFIFAQVHMSLSWASGSESGGGSSAVDDKKEDNKSEKREEMRRKMREKRNQKCTESCEDGKNCCSSHETSKSESKETGK